MAKLNEYIYVYKLVYLCLKTFLLTLFVIKKAVYYNFLIFALQMSIPKLALMPSGDEKLFKGIAIGRLCRNIFSELVILLVIIKFQNILKLFRINLFYDNDSQEMATPV